jgi:hypothetical protein
MDSRAMEPRQLPTRKKLPVLVKLLTVKMNSENTRNAPEAVFGQTTTSSQFQSPMQVLQHIH